MRPFILLVWCVRCYAGPKNVLSHARLRSLAGTFHTQHSGVNFDIAALGEERILAGALGSILLIVPRSTILPVLA